MLSLAVAGAAAALGSSMVGDLSLLGDAACHSCHAELSRLAELVHPGPHHDED